MIYDMFVEAEFLNELLPHIFWLNFYLDINITISSVESNRTKK